MRPIPARLAHGAYSLLLRLLQPAYLVRLWWRGRSEPTYRAAMGERFGAYDAASEAAASTGWIWVHAVSLGETRAAAALIDALRLARPGMRLLLTHGTATGREAGVELLRAGDLQVWQPYDTRQAVARFFARFRPAVGVLMETEVWPNLLHGARLNAVPMVLANARLSERSQRKGERMEALLRPAVESLALALAQTEDDAQRLREAGARDVVVAGNLKFDMTPDDAQLARGALWRRGLGRDVLLAAVTREGEEALLLEAWARQPTPEHGRPLLLIVPRHPPRFDEVAAQVQAAGLTLARRSAWDDSPPAEALVADVWLGDSMREMALYYGFAQVALLGGSFAPLGGQNLIEAAACGCPIVMGPHTFNFTEAAELALAAGAALRAADIDGALQEALALLATPARLAQRSRAAQQFAATHRGAAQRMAQRIVALLPGD